MNNNKYLKNIINSFANRNVILPALIVPTLFLGITASFIWSPIKTFISESLSTTASESNNSFNRLIGQALVNGVDIGKRLDNMKIFSFLYLPLIFILIYILLYKIFSKTESFDSDSFRFLRKVCFACFPALLIGLITQNSDSFLNWFLLIPQCIVIFVLLYIRFGQKLIEIEEFKWVIFASLSMLAVFMSSYWRMVYKENRFKYNEFMLILIFTIFVILLFVLSVFFSRRGLMKPLCDGFIPMAISPILFCVYFEIANILNQHGITIKNRNKICHIILLFCVLICISSYYFSKIFKTNAKSNIINSHILFPILVLAISVLSIQPLVQITVGTELFESANAAGDVIGLLKYGEIPIIENLNVHMFGYDIGNILYGFLNQDYIGSIFYGYQLFIPFLYLAIYYLLVEISDKENAILIVLFFPLSGMFGFEYYGIGIFAILAAINMYKRRNIFAITLFCISCAMLCLYRFDLGYMFSTAAIIVLTITFIYEKQWKSTIKLWICGITTGVCALAALYIVCIIRRIPFILRLKEFLDIMSSGDKWAYYTIGENPNNYWFYLSYLIIPTLMLITTTLLLFNKKRIKMRNQEYLIILILACAFLFNYQRSIVRHNLVETNWKVIFATAPLGIVIALYYLRGKKDYTLSFYLCLILIMQYMCGYTLLEGNLLLLSGIDRQSDLSISSSYESKINRVIFEDELYEIYLPLKEFFEIVLNDEETYLDYTFDTTLYALTERKKPVYTNQSPSQLNSEFSQMMFVAEIETSKCPLALVRSYDYGWDGVPLNINQYIVAEYLNMNYKPFYQVGRYQVWVLIDEYQNRKSKLNEYYMSNEIDNELYVFNEIDYYYEQIPRVYNIGEVAYLWGTYDIKNQQEIFISIQNIELNENINIYPSSIEKSDGNYIEIVVNSENDGISSLITTENGQELLRFNFNIHKGQNRYKIRISGDPLWYSGLIDGITIASDEYMEVKTLNILRGDTISDKSIEYYTSKLKNENGGK